MDDKSAKSLLGESFKRQLKYDGTYSRVTFICSKTDDISVSEATEGLGLSEQMGEYWNQCDILDIEIQQLKNTIKATDALKKDYAQLIDDADDVGFPWL